MNQTSHISIILNILTVYMLCLIAAGKTAPPPVIDIGLSDIIDSATVYAALICNDGSNDIRITSSLTGTAVHSNFTLVSKARAENYPHLISTVPLKITKWPSIFAKPCPHHAHGHRAIDRGIGLSHYQIWLDLIFFDRDLLEALTRPKPEYLNSTAYSSTSGAFSTLSNGSFIKNGVPFLENDILVVLEESAFLPSGSDKAALKTVLSKELAQMNTDLLYLGWCSHNSTVSSGLSRSGHGDHAKRGAKSHHAHHTSAHTSVHSQSCMYAYAVTRRGARKLVRHYDLCASVSLEEQIAAMSRYGWVSSRRVGSDSVQSALSGGGMAAVAPDSQPVVISSVLQQLRNESRSAGIFHQMKERI